MKQLTSLRAPHTHRASAALAVFTRPCCLRRLTNEWRSLVTMLGELFLLRELTYVSLHVHQTESFNFMHRNCSAGKFTQWMNMLTISTYHNTAHVNMSDYTQ